LSVIKPKPLDFTLVQNIAVQSESRPAVTDDDYARVIDTALLRAETRFGAPVDAGALISALESPFAQRTLPETHLVRCRKIVGDRSALSRAAAGASKPKEPSNTLVGLRAAISRLDRRQASAGPDTAEDLRQRAIAHIPTPVDVEIMQHLLEKVPPDGERIMDELAKNPGIHELFHEWIGVRETYSLRTHNSMVYAQLEEQRPHYDPSKLRVPDGVNLDRLLAIIPALHDIGKPAAVEIGQKEAQHVFTLPVIESVLRSYGFNEKEIALASAIVGEDAIGYTVHDKKETYSPAQAHADLTRLALEVGMDPKDFLILKKLYFISDASAYPLLRDDPEERALRRIPGTDPVKREAAHHNYRALKQLFGVD
jgi:hypothetical protein